MAERLHPLASRSNRVDDPHQTRPAGPADPRSMAETGAIRVLIAYGDNDIPHLDEMANDMHATLKKAGSPSELLRCEHRNHATVGPHRLDEFYARSRLRGSGERKFLQVERGAQQ